MFNHPSRPIGVKQTIMKYTQSEITRIGSHEWDYWKVAPRETNGTTGFEIHWSDDGECVTDHVYTKQDANLIAASPLLYETLKHLSTEGGLGPENQELIQTALRIAEGK